MPDCDNKEMLKREILRRYRAPEARGRILRDMIAKDLSGGDNRILDIGCGGGIDKNAEFLQSLSQCATLIGIEPDPEVSPDPCFQDVRRCMFEQADFPESYFNLVYCTMVLEHIREPEIFWAKLHKILKPGGVFWALTVDARSPFAIFSNFFEKLHLKDWYLNRLRGTRGDMRYENYPTFYRANSPSAIRKQTRCFSDHFFVSLYRRRQMDYYVPRSFRPMMRIFDVLVMGFRVPGSVLMVRLQK